MAMLFILLLAAVALVAWVLMRTGQQTVAQVPAAIPQVIAPKAPPAPSPPQPPTVPPPTKPEPAPPEKVAPPENAAPAPVKPQLEAATPSGVSPKLQYQWKEGELYNYHFTIEATVLNQRNTFSGFSAYTPRKPNLTIRREPVACSGTAFVVGADGYLLTCQHCVADATSIEVVLNGKTYQGKVLAGDEQLDVALLKIEAAGLTPLALADGQRVELGQEVRSVGYPLSDMLGESVKVTRGSVAGTVKREGRELYQVDASINPGNSGGPVVDTRGRVVGMASEKLYGSKITNVGLCVPADEIRRWLDGKPAKAQLGGDGAELSGPELVKKVTPGVALLKVMLSGQHTGQAWDLQSSSTLFTADRPGLSLGLKSHSDHGTLQVTQWGELLDEGDSQSLPMLLGPVAGLTVEPLDLDGHEQWKREWTISIVRQKEPPRDASPFAAMPPHLRGRWRSPFDSRERPRIEVELIPAVETLEYKLTEMSPTSATIEKRMKIATQEGQQQGLEISTAGKLVFNRQRGVMESAELQGAYALISESVTLRVPLKISYKPYDQAAQQAAVASRNPAKVENKEPDPKVKDQLDLLEKASTDKSVALQALHALTAMPRDRDSRSAAVTSIAELLASADDELRVAAIEALAHWDWSSKLDDVLPLLKHAHAPTRLAAIDYCGEMQDGAAAEALCERMSQPEDREKIAAALREIGPAAENAVLELLKHSDSAVRVAACGILSEIGSDDSAAALHKLAVGNDPAAAASKAALEKMGYSVTPPAKPPAKPAVEDDDENPFAPATPKPQADDDENPFAPESK
jgi:S1-C subfamily serine protease